MSYEIRKIGFLPPFYYKPVVKQHGRTFVQNTTFRNRGLAVESAELMEAILYAKESRYINADWLDTIGWREE